MDMKDEYRELNKRNSRTSPIILDPNVLKNKTSRRNSAIMDESIV